MNLNGLRASKHEFSKYPLFTHVSTKVDSVERSGVILDILPLTDTYWYLIRTRGDNLFCCKEEDIQCTINYRCVPVLHCSHCGSHAIEVYQCVSSIKCKNCGITITGSSNDYENLVVLWNAPIWSVYLCNIKMSGIWKNTLDKYDLTLKGWVSDTLLAVNNNSIMNCAY